MRASCRPRCCAPHREKTERTLHAAALCEGTPGRGSKYSRGNTKGLEDTSPRHPWPARQRRPHAQGWGRCVPPGVGSAGAAAEGLHRPQAPEAGRSWLPTAPAARGAPRQFRGERRGTLWLETDPRALQRAGQTRSAPCERREMQKALLLQDRWPLPRAGRGRHRGQTRDQGEHASLCSGRELRRRGDAGLGGLTCVGRHPVPCHPGELSPPLPAPLPAPRGQCRRPNCPSAFQFRDLSLLSSGSVVIL